MRRIDTSVFALRFSNIRKQKVIDGQMFALQLIAKKVILGKGSVNKKSYIRITHFRILIFGLQKNSLMEKIKRG